MLRTDLVRDFGMRSSWWRVFGLEEVEKPEQLEELEEVEEVEEVGRPASATDRGD